MSAWKKRAVKERTKLVNSLTRWRVIRKKSQQDLCRDVGSAQAQLSRIEVGTTGLSLGLVLDMSKALDCELMVVPTELRSQVFAIVDRFAQERELDLGPRTTPGRKRGSGREVHAGMLASRTPVGMGAGA
ncbi:MAG: helix-turn-helix transcriptional regulator [Rhizobiales bacterium]|nr:helix-turn-helix transcriptional regulator [Hyphomicrobiales bacterium]